MLFNSNEFLVFFALFCGAYFAVGRNIRLRNLVIIAGSYIFYGSWDVRFTALLLFTSVWDFALARRIEITAVPAGRRALLAASIGLNVLVLITFKYLNFFRESFDSLLGSLGMETHSSWTGWSIVLPVGISFYTFQSMGYVVDVYRRQVPASRDFIQYQAFVSFFPQLVAGPIERARHMLPQFARPLEINAEDVGMGLWLVLWGLFKKVVLADNLAPMVELCYRHAVPSTPVVLLGTLAFALQIYCDFSGYSDVARGLARLLGFELMINFNLPYVATSLRDFWGRWHISFSTWLRDYLYIPLGGSRRGGARTYLNLAVTMLICGLWHGAALTFLLWGLWHGLGLIINRWYFRRNSRLGSLPPWLGWLATMLFVLYGWMLFRAESFEQILQFNRALANLSLPGWWLPYLSNLFVLALPLALIEGRQWRSGESGLPFIPKLRPRAWLQGAMLLTLIAFWQTGGSPFIYFQF